MSSPDPAPINHADIKDAAARLTGVVVETPLLRSAALDALTGGRVLLKAEPLQRTGSFKIRGAYNRMSRLSEAERKRGVVAFSSGNHAQAVAAAAQALGIGATIVMPADAPAMKRNNTIAFGAEVVSYDRANESREAIAEEIAKTTGATLIRPYDDRFVIAGQGTVGLEIAEQMNRLGVSPDTVLVPCGGGGLVAGTAMAARHRFPKAEVHSVEPTDYDDTARSLAAGKRVSATPNGLSICDALLVPTPGALTFALNQQQLGVGLTVSDDAVRNAMRLAFGTLKIVVEPGGAVALAALLDGMYDARDKTVVAVLSGGNVDAEAFRAVLADAG